MIPATADVASCPEAARIVDKREGFPESNHYIITEYVDGDHHIGFHFDKPRSICKGSLITVVKTGECGRPFQVRELVNVRNAQGEDLEALKGRHRAETRQANCEGLLSVTERQEKELRALKKDQDSAQSSTQPFFDEVLEPGTAVIMTLEANLRTQHGVPEVSDSGPSGSLVFRTISEVVRPGTREVVAA